MQYQVNQEIDELEDEINRLDKKNQELENLIEYLETDQFVDRQAREGLNFKKPGEEVVVIKDGSSQAQLATSGQAVRDAYGISGSYTGNRQQQATNPGRWWRYFFGSS